MVPPQAPTTAPPVRCQDRGMRRRTFLSGCAGALVVGGCTRDADVDPGPRRPDPDARVRAAVGASERELLAAYAAVLAAHPQLRASLGAMMAHHGAHLTRITGEPAPAQPTAAQPTATQPSATQPSATEPSATQPSATEPTPTAVTGTAAPGPAPGMATPRAALDLLRAAERRARAQRVAACDLAVDATLARDLVLIAASEDQHGTRLGSLLAGIAGDGRG